VAKICVQWAFHLLISKQTSQPVKRSQVPQVHPKVPWHPWLQAWPVLLALPQLVQDLLVVPLLCPLSNKYCYESL
jgi:hypothetical protein